MFTEPKHLNLLKFTFDQLIKKKKT